jgi:hypothetical protein
MASAIGLCGGVAPALGAEVIDRILAVVDGQIITLSDAQAVLRFRLLPPEVGTDPVEVVMRRLIDRRLMLTEVERYAPPEPPAAAVDRVVAEIRSRFKDELAFEVALNQTVLSRDQLRRHIRDSIRIDTYLQQRFASVAEPSEDDIVRYYKDHAPDFMANGVQLSFEQARAQVRQRIVDLRQRQAVADWLEGLRRRSAISVLYLPGR